MTRHEHVHQNASSHIGWCGLAGDSARPNVYIYRKNGHCRRALTRGLSQGASEATKALNCGKSASEQMCLCSVCDKPNYKIIDARSMFMRVEICAYVVQHTHSLPIFSLNWLMFQLQFCCRLESCSHRILGSHHWLNKWNCERLMWACLL